MAAVVTWGQNGLIRAGAPQAGLFDQGSLPADTRALVTAAGSLDSAAGQLVAAVARGTFGLATKQPCPGTSSRGLEHFPGRHARGKIYVGVRSWSTVGPAGALAHVGGDGGTEAALACWAWSNLLRTPWHGRTRHGRNSPSCCSA